MNLITTLSRGLVTTLLSKRIHDAELYDADVHHASLVSPQPRGTKRCPPFP